MDETKPQSESINARKGIKTVSKKILSAVTTTLCPNQSMPVRALRQIAIFPDHLSPFWSESINARKGIKTENVEVSTRHTRLVRINQCP